MSPPHLPFPLQVTSDGAADEASPELPDLLLQSQDSTGSVSAEDALLLRAGTPSLEASLDTANSQLPEVGRGAGGGTANPGSL